MEIGNIFNTKLNKNHPHKWKIFKPGVGIKYYM